MTDRDPNYLRREADRHRRNGIYEPDAEQLELNADHIDSLEARAEKAEREREELRNALIRVRDIHASDSNTYGPGLVRGLRCSECDGMVPCLSVRMVNDALSGESEEG